MYDYKTMFSKYKCMLKIINDRDLSEDAIKIARKNFKKESLLFLGQINSNIKEESETSKLHTNFQLDKALDSVTGMWYCKEREIEPEPNSKFGRLLAVGRSAQCIWYRVDCNTEKFQEIMKKVIDMPKVPMSDLQKNMSYVISHLKKWFARRRFSLWRLSERLSDDLKGAGFPQNVQTTYKRIDSDLLKAKLVKSILEKYKNWYDCMYSGDSNSDESDEEDLLDESDEEDLLDESDEEDLLSDEEALNKDLGRAAERAKVLLKELDDYRELLKYIIAEAKGAFSALLAGREPYWSTLRQRKADLTLGWTEIQEAKKNPTSKKIIAAIKKVSTRENFPISKKEVKDLCNAVAAAEKKLK